MSITTAEVNGNVAVMGIVIASIGVWVECSFGIAMIVLGTSLAALGLLAAGFGTPGERDD